MTNKLFEILSKNQEHTINETLLSPQTIDNYKDELLFLTSNRLIIIETFPIDNRITKLPNLYEAMYEGGLQQWLDKKERDQTRENELKRLGTELTKSNIELNKLTKRPVIMSALISFLMLLVLAVQTFTNQKTIVKFEDKISLSIEQTLELQRKIIELDQNLQNGVNSVYIDTITNKKDLK